MSEPTLDPRVVELRRAFDHGFAEAAGSTRGVTSDLLLIGIGEVSYALRVSDMLALSHDRRLLRVPTGMAGLVGLCGFRGEVIPVFSLASLLDHPAGATTWVAVGGRRTEPVGLAFDTLAGYASVEPARIHPISDTRNPYLTATVTLDDSVRAIVDLPSLLALVESRELALHRPKEP